MKFLDRQEEGQKRFIALVEEMSGESDRAVAIVGAAWVEEALSDAVRPFLHAHDKSQERLFSGNAPLSTFSAKIDLARLLGIITDQIWSDLHSIRDIRNTFAHHIAHKTDHTKLTFATDSIKDKSLNLKCVFYESHTDPRVAFTRACATLNADFDVFTMMGEKVADTFRIVAKGVDAV
jgi:hypothetical protein